MKTFSTILIVTSPAFAGSAIGFAVFLFLLITGYLIYRHSERAREKWEQEKESKEFDESEMYK